MAKRSSDPRVAYPEVTVQVRDLVRFVGIIAPLPHGESVFGESSIYRDPGCKWAQETCAGCPLAEVRHGRARQSSGTGPFGDCRRVLREAGTRGQYSWNIRFKFIEKPGVQDKGGRHDA